MRNNLSELRREAEDYFRQVERDLNASNEAYRHILRMRDASLAAEDYTKLPELIPYMEEGEGHLALQYIGKSHRLLRILNIIKLEISGTAVFALMDFKSCFPCALKPSSRAYWV